MPRTNPGLTDEQVAKLRTAAAGPRKPRVTLLDTQFGADATGQVVTVGDPATDGDDFITVRVRIGGVADTLTFGPGELAVPTRAGKAAPKAKRVPPTAPTRQPAAPKPTVAAPTPATPAPAATAPAATTRPPASATQPPATATQPAAAGVPTGSTTRPTRQAVRQPKAVAAPSVPAAARPQRSAAARRRAPAQVTVTVTSSGHSWTMAATRGGRSLVKSAPVPAGVITAAVELFDDAALREAVAEINDVALSEAQERADQLREELAKVESLLKSHQRPARQPGRRS
ncbi:hypothetical protein [Nakamurella lactea]|uniref:hypothetical protein n=1 Tax=Nakamurella lactea TaxID=459515 RepID=UPI000424CB8B|nr:hypothetical protein [Nakamurella lactea]